MWADILLLLPRWALGLIRQAWELPVGSGNSSSPQAAGDLLFSSMQKYPSEDPEGPLLCFLGEINQ